MAITLSSSSTLLFGAGAILNYDVTNNGTIDATNVTADFTLPPNLTLDSVSASAGTCTSGAGTVSCAIGVVPGMSNRTVDISTTPATLGPGMINATVSADVDERPGNNLEALLLTVAPAVDLVVNTPSGASIKLSESTTISATLENRATLDASGVNLTIDLGNALQATAASWAIGSCTVLAQQVSCQAATFGAQSSSTVSVTATGISAGRPNITVTLSSIEADLVPGDNSGNGRLTVKDPKEDSGGATGLLFLGLLVALIGVRRRHRQTA
jgi:uncharacterized repeat protein (TIGR01451 family)/MYXO-CTERM domain-containing protein